MESKFDRDKKKLFNRIWSCVPEKYKPIVIVIISMAVLVVVFLSGRNLNFQSITLKTNMPINIDGRSIENLIINNYYIRPDGTLITEATGRDIMTGQTVGIKYASPPSVAVSEEVKNHQ